MAAHSNDPQPEAAPSGTRSVVARGFTLVEDVVYVGLGLLLSASAVTLLGSTAVSFARVSFREHAIMPEPFLIIGLVAATRRILVLTAELTGLQDKSESAFRFAMIELGLLTVMVIALVASLLMLRGRPPFRRRHPHLRRLLFPFRACR